MIIDNLDVFGVTCAPDKTETPLIVDTNAVLTGAVALERLKAIAWWNLQVVNRGCRIKNFQLSARDLFNVSKTLYALAPKQLLSIFVAKRLYHSQIVTEAVNTVKRYALFLICSAGR
jgi:hypothetical protein